MISRKPSNIVGQNQNQEHSKLVIKNKRPGRKSIGLIHCIPKFSKVLPTKHMSEAQKALQNKIRRKTNPGAEITWNTREIHVYFSVISPGYPPVQWFPVVENSFYPREIHVYFPIYPRVYVHKLSTNVWKSLLENVFWPFLQTFWNRLEIDFRKTFLAFWKCNIF